MLARAFELSDCPKSSLGILGWIGQKKKKTQRGNERIVLKLLLLSATVNTPKIRPTSSCLNSPNPKLPAEDALRDLGRINYAQTTADSKRQMSFVRWLTLSCLRTEVKWSPAWTVREWMTMTIHNIHVMLHLFPPLSSWVRNWWWVACESRLKPLSR